MLTTFGIMYNILEGPDGHMESVYKDLILMTLRVINIISLQKWLKTTSSLCTFPIIYCC